MHEDIKNRKSLDTLLSNQEGFEIIKGMLLLFNRNSEYYRYSGQVTAALLDFEGIGSEKNITVLALTCPMLDKLITFKLNKDQLSAVLKSCDAFIGNSLETSFILEEKFTFDAPIPVIDRLKCEDIPKEGYFEFVHKNGQIMEFYLYKNHLFGPINELTTNQKTKCIELCKEVYRTLLEQKPGKDGTFEEEFKKENPNFNAIDIINLLKSKDLLFLLDGDVEYITKDV